MRPRDTNPHFVSPYETQQQDQYPQTQSPPPAGPLVPIPQHYGLHFGPSPLSPERSERLQPAAPTRPRGKHQSKPLGRLGPLVPITHHDQDQHSRPKKQSRRSQPPPPAVPLAPMPHDAQDQHPGPKHESHDSVPLVISAAPIPHDAHTPHRSHERPHRSHEQTTGGSHGLHLPLPQSTNFFTWSAGVCCAIFWVMIILAGLIILIVYLVFRPRTPKFEISTATLNAAYLDMGDLLNADFTVLVNFTNPNKKASLYFSPMYIDAYYGSTLIATTYIEPFTARKHQSMFANVHMVASQVRLGLLQSQRLKKQLETSRAVFEFRGSFRARAHFGSLLPYLYKLHGDCSIVFSRPPDGVMVGRKCKTRHQS
ncbi:hypothetical protein M0R45_000872 [Rubus argutus]|uniref:Late embryogenesis abundant protein LEA-2 subgroup domain-containing protein n=1 Tax=Rubus argutus TaxID=59490 RepID=A0AAW1VN97_RUBAR